MKKLKMWYIKLAFAALFFTLIVQIISSLSYRAHEINNAVPLVVSTQKAQAEESEFKEEQNAQVQQVQPEPVNQAPQKKQISQKSVYPYQLVIPKIGVNAGVVGMGLTSDGKMAVPNNFTEVGWYNLGPKPGEMGSVVFGAHVDNGGSVAGVFKNLKNLEIGDSIYVSDANGNKLEYVVSERKVLDYKSQDTTEVFGRNDAKRLNLITCHGQWISGENTYNGRLVVYALLKS